jgi:hypothetical protein
VAVSETKDLTKRLWGERQEKSVTSVLEADSSVRAALVSVLAAELGHHLSFDRPAGAEPGKPFFVTMLVYVDEVWELEWDAETMILDSGSNTGVFIRPVPGRMLLLDQVCTRPFQITFTSMCVTDGGRHSWAEVSWSSSYM